MVGANEALPIYDLGRHSGTYGINDDSIARLLSYVQTEQERGLTVYYHYTTFEDSGWPYHTNERDFDAYFVALQQTYTMRELVRINERPQRLYILEAPAASRW